MLSRVAESLYWMSRYIERAENIARMIDVNNNLLLDFDSETQSQQWQPMIVAMDETKAFEKNYKEYTEENVVRFLTFDENNPNSIYSCISSARFNARTVRENISPEMFNEINKIYHKLNASLQLKADASELKSLYEEMISFCHLMIGLVERTLLQDEGFHFIKLGRLLERADKITRILDLKYFILLPSVGYVNTPLDDIQWAALLKSASAFEPYRKKYHKIEYDNIINFLVLGNDFPRSVRYCCRRVEYMLRVIDPIGGSLSVLKIMDLNRELNAVTVADIKAKGLHEYLDHIQQKLNDIGASIYKDFFFLTYT